ncbi:putative leader peptide [Actinacidiphila acididurans]|uniref:putative leader peptide n=1 Tax=Actinacidiphila acididurans TaxID=2784346 RepID=UPI00355896AA
MSVRDHGLGRGSRSERGGDAVQGSSERPFLAVALFSRRHIDFRRVAGALCPGRGARVPRATP